MTEIVLENDFLECPICLETFDDTCKMLPCQHTFHKRCLQKIYSMEERLECPQCRQLVSEDIDLLPRNYFLLSVLDKAKQKSLEIENQESLQLQLICEKSKTEAEIKAREEYLLSQKEKLEYELMLLKSEKKECAVFESPLQGSSSSSSCFSIALSECGAKDNCSTSLEERRSEACAQDCEKFSEASSQLLQKLEGLEIAKLSNKSPAKKQPETESLNSVSPHSLERQVADGFDVLNMHKKHSSLTDKLLEIVKAVNCETNFSRIELMHLIDYDDLIGNYLKILADLSNDNSFSGVSYPSNENTTAADPLDSASGCTDVTNIQSVASVSSVSPFADCGGQILGNHSNDVAAVPSESICGFNSTNGNVNYASSTFNPVMSRSQSGLANDYSTYAFDDDESNLAHAMELSRQLMVANESDDVMEEVLSKSKIMYAIDQQKMIFLCVREKVELQIALLMSEI